MLVLLCTFQSNLSGRNLNLTEIYITNTLGIVNGIVLSERAVYGFSLEKLMEKFWLEFGMKWIVRWAMVLPVLLCWSFQSCQQLKERQERTRNWMANTKAIKVLCTTEHVACLVRSVGGDAVDTLVLIENGSDPHSYQLVKGDNEKFRVADLICSSGLGLEKGSSCARSLARYRAYPIAEYAGGYVGQPLDLALPPIPICGWICPSGLVVHLVSLMSFLVFAPTYRHILLAMPQPPMSD